MSEHIDHKQALTNLIPNGDGYNSDYAATLAGAVEYVEQIEQKCAEMAEALERITAQLERVGDTRPHKDGQFIEDARAALAKYHDPTGR